VTGQKRPSVLLLLLLLLLYPIYTRTLVVLYHGIIQYYSAINMRTLQLLSTISTLLTSLERGASLIRTVLILTILGSTQAQLEPYQKCHETFRDIINGSLALGSLNNVTIWESGYLYTGHFRLLDPSYPRDNIITPTFIGKSSFLLPPSAMREPVLTICQDAKRSVALQRS
jgi:hypothetical protein